MLWTYSLQPHNCKDSYPFVFVIFTLDSSIKYTIWNKLISMCISLSDKNVNCDPGNAAIKPALASLPSKRYHGACL